MLSNNVLINLIVCIPVISRVTFTMVNGTWNISGSILLPDSPAVWESPIAKQFQSEKYTSLFLIAYLLYIVIMLLLSFYIGFCCSFPSWCCCFLKENSDGEETVIPDSPASEEEHVDKKELIVIDCKAESGVKENIPPPKETLQEVFHGVFSIAENIKKLVKIVKSLHRQQQKGELITRISVDYRSSPGVEVV